MASNDAACRIGTAPGAARAKHHDTGLSAGFCAWLGPVGSFGLRITEVIAVVTPDLMSNGGDTLTG
jgi:hypothetical protein